MKFSFVFALLMSVLFIPINDVFAQENHPDYQILVGNWARPDGGYVLSLKNINDDGHIDAAYFNPNIINVSKAQVTTGPGQLNVFVELQDKGYPGSYYTLTYNPGNDRLEGVYHHLVLKQDFNIYFIRK
jgi:hypothetical protein